MLLYRCTDCDKLTHHLDSEDGLECRRCHNIAVPPCAHDLIERDTTGHLSCADCRRSFE